MTQDSHHRYIIYEQPLSERIRTLLRLESLFQRAQHLLGQEAPWASRLIFDVIIDLLTILKRASVKKELVNELERHSTTLDALSPNPNIDPGQLSKIQVEIHSALQMLNEHDIASGEELRHNELLNSVRQRSSIPAGACDFDLPAFHYWLERPDSQRLCDLRNWLSTFDVFNTSIVLCLRLVRESADATHEVAIGGFYQRNLNSTTPCQMIQIALPRESSLYPEISAGIQRFTVRFLHPGDNTSRPTQTKEDVDFNLLCCAI